MNNIIHIIRQIEDIEIQIIQIVRLYLEEEFVIGIVSL